MPLDVPSCTIPLMKSGGGRGWIMIGFVGAFFFALGAITPAEAQRLSPTPVLTVTESPTPTPLPTQPPEDLTQPKGETKGRLERLLDEQTLGPLSLTTVIQHAIRQAVGQGVPPNTIVLLLLFPVVATMIAAARHVVGLRGFGVFTPAVIAVTFLATGLRLGLTLFIAIMIIATAGRMILRYLRLQYLPQMAQLILFLCLGIIGILLLSPTILMVTGSALGFDRLVSIGIFPILVLILLTETFISTQIVHGWRRAANVTVETILLATVSFLAMNVSEIQDWVLTNPEVTIMGVALSNIALGRFTGLRILEYWRFRELLRK